MQPIVVYGASGHGKVVADAARAAGYDLRGFLDDDSARHGSECLGARVLGGAERLQGLVAASVALIVGIGDNAARRRLQARALDAGCVLAVVVHPAAIVAPTVTIGPGTVVCARAAINPDARVDQGVILNTACVIEHDCDIGAFAHISPGAALGGGVTIGAGSHVGLGALVLPGKRVGDRVVVGAGAVVIDDLPAGVTVIGVPARVLEQRRAT